MTLTGTCLCGNITVTVKTPPESLTAGYCHCENCQKTAGSVLSHNLVVPINDLEITGELSHYTDTATSSGIPLTRSFCKNCGNPIRSAGPQFGDAAIIKLGIFGADETPKPSFECFTKNKKPFVAATEGVAQFEAAPPLEK